MVVDAEFLDIERQEGSSSVIATIVVKEPISEMVRLRFQ